MYNKYNLYLSNNVLYGGANTQAQINKIWERITQIWSEHKPENLEKIDQFKKEWNTLDRAYILLKAAEEKYVKNECLDQQLITDYFPFIQSSSSHQSLTVQVNSFASEWVQRRAVRAENLARTNPAWQSDRSQLYNEKCNELPELYGTSDLNDLVFDYWHIVNVKTKYFRPWSKFIIPDIKVLKGGDTRDIGTYNTHSFNKDVINLFLESEKRSVFTVHNDAVGVRHETFNYINPQSVQYKSFIEGTDNGVPYYRSVLNVPVNLELVDQIDAVNVNTIIPDTNHPLGKKIRNRLLFKQDKPLLILNKPEVKQDYYLSGPNGGPPRFPYRIIELVNPRLVINDNALVSSGNNMLVSNMVPTLGEVEDTYSYNLVENLYNKKYFPFYFYLTRHIFTGIIEVLKQWPKRFNLGLDCISPHRMFLIIRRLGINDKLSYDGITELSEDEIGQFNDNYESIINRIVTYNRNDPITHIYTASMQDPEKLKKLINYLTNAGDQKFKDILLNLATQQFIENNLIGLLSLCINGIGEIISLGIISKKSKDFYPESDINARRHILNKISEMLDALVRKYIINGNMSLLHKNYIDSVKLLIKMILYDFYNTPFFQNFNYESLRNELSLPEGFFKAKKPVDICGADFLSQRCGRADDGAQEQVDISQIPNPYGLSDDALLKKYLFDRQRDQKRLSVNAEVQKLKVDEEIIKRLDIRIRDDSKFLNPLKYFRTKDTWGQEHLMYMMLIECNRTNNQNREIGIVPKGNRIGRRHLGDPVGQEVELGAYPILKIILQEDKYKYFSSLHLPLPSTNKFERDTKINFHLQKWGVNKLGYSYILFLYRLISNIIQDKYLSEYESKTSKMMFDYMTTGKMNFVDNPELQAMSDRIDELSAKERNAEEDQELKELSEKIFLFRNMDGPEEEGDEFDSEDDEDGDDSEDDEDEDDDNAGDDGDMPRFLKILDETERGQLIQFLTDALEEYDTLNSPEVRVKVMEKFQITDAQFTQLLQFAYRNRVSEEGEEEDEEDEEDDSMDNID